MITKKILNIEVSVFCLAYNHEKYIKQALDSIISQKTNFKFEIIVNDDASTDNTMTILKEYQQKYPDLIKPIFHSENEYSKDKLNSYSKILKYAKGKYIALCECDDFWLDNKKLQTQYEALERNPNVNLCFCRTSLVEESGISKNCYFGDFGTKEMIIPTCKILQGGGEIMGTNSIMVRKSIYYKVKNFYNEFGKQPVGDIIIQAIGSHAFGALYLPYTFASYRTNSIGSWTLSNKNLNISYVNNKALIKLYKDLDIYFKYKYSKILIWKSNRYLLSICKSAISSKKKKLVFKEYKEDLTLREYLKCLFLFTRVGFYVFIIYRKIRDFTK